VDFKEIIFNVFRNFRNIVQKLRHKVTISTKIKKGFTILFQ